MGNPEADKYAKLAGFRKGIALVYASRIRIYADEPEKVRELTREMEEKLNLSEELCRTHQE